MNITGSGIYWIVALTAAAALALLLVGMFYLSVRWNRKIQTVWGQVEATLGLFNEKPKSPVPSLRGQLEGADVVLDIYTPPLPDARRTPWTRARAQLKRRPQVQVQHKGQKYGGEITYPSRPTGDVTLDDRYTIFMPDNVSLDEALPPSVRTALLEADPPVHVLNNVVMWTKRGVENSDSQLLIKALQSCAHVAAAFNNQQQPV